MMSSDEEEAVLQTVEAIVEKNGTVRLLESIQPTRRMRAILTVLEPTDEPTPPHKRPLREFVGVLKNSSAFAGDPVAIQRTMRSEWD